MNIWSLDKIFVIWLKWRTLLVLDGPTTHKASKVAETSKEYDTFLLMIPSGLKLKLQHLDVSINKVLKENLI